MHFNALRSPTQPWLDCILYLTQHLYEPGNVYLRPNQSINLHLLSLGLIRGVSASSGAKLNVDWPAQNVFVQNKSWRLIRWVGQCQKSC